MKSTREDIWARWLIALGHPHYLYQPFLSLLKNRGLYLSELTKYIRHIERESSSQTESQPKSPVEGRQR